VKSDPQKIECCAHPALLTAYSDFVASSKAKGTFVQESLVFQSVSISAASQSDARAADINLLLVSHLPCRNLSGTHVDSADAIVSGGFKIGGQGVPVRHGDSNGTGQSAIDKARSQMWQKIPHA